ncbi:hypothetical protein BHE74_00057614 [Ensete ventricosum]|nr:hypothetical protein GW17_00050996 [Ensete ventricosum]RWW37297.1 hypothetical protein BHE74_00057614 [Ensete ventricosum]RZS27853.1 hypothetical protein BHM03_00061379 [Ensete ventricosum]
MGHLRAAQAPQCLGECDGELDRVVVRERWVEEKEVHQFSYVEAIIKKTMRMHPVAPLLVPHLSSEHTTFDGYVVPIGTPVLPHQREGARLPATIVQGGRRMCSGYSLSPQGDPAEPSQPAAWLVAVAEHVLKDRVVR